MKKRLRELKKASKKEKKRHKKNKKVISWECTPSLASSAGFWYTLVHIWAME